MAKQKIKEIKLPKSIDDLRIKHLDLINRIDLTKDFSVPFMVEMISELSGESVDTIRRIDVQDVITLWKQAIKVFGGFKANEKPLEEITINGQVYEMVNPHKVASGWHMDLDNTNTAEEPERFAGLMYIEKGTSYGEEDRNKSVIYPLAERSQIFAEHMKLVDYITATSFFLSKYG